MNSTAFPWLDGEPSNGSFNVDQPWHLDFVPYVDFIIKITYESLYSSQPDDDRIVEDQFVLRIGDICELDTLTKNSEFEDWTYIIWSTQEVESR